jgi:hypothetical protein
VLFVGLSRQTDRFLKFASSRAVFEKVGFRCPVPLRQRLYR